MTVMGPKARGLSLYAHFGSNKHASALTTLYFGLFNDDPFGTGHEPSSAGGYGRAVVTNNAALWGAFPATALSIVTASDIVWPSATGAWSLSPLTHWGVMSTNTLGAGELWYADVIPGGGFVVAATGDQPRILAGGLTFIQGG
jgi:hypothetical protein